LRQRGELPAEIEGVVITGIEAEAAGRREQMS
jgi:hypothetical protein